MPTSEGLRTLLVEPEAPGGQAGSSSRIENYLGFPTGISGAELAKRAYLQANRFGTEFLAQTAVGIRSENHYHYLCLADGKELSCRVSLDRGGRQLPAARTSRAWTSSPGPVSTTARR